MNNKLSTYCASIDFKKAFDCINREFLLYKLLLYNIDGKLFKAINGLYNDSRSCINLNDVYTKFSDVKQGDPLSHLLFNLFINDLAKYPTNEQCGVKVGIDKVILAVMC